MISIVVTIDEKTYNTLIEDSRRKSGESINKKPSNPLETGKKKSGNLI